ncbi:hypothetical protein ACRRTK_016317 [Alexandromys fortis]
MTSFFQLQHPIKGTGFPFCIPGRLYLAGCTEDYISQAGEMAQQLRAVIALCEDPNLMPSTYAAGHNFV